MKKLINKISILYIVSVFLLAIITPSLSFAEDTPKDDGTKTITNVICNVIEFIQKLGLPIMTVIIIGSSVMAVFGRLAWPAIVMLIAFSAIFFGASKVVSIFVKGVGSNADGKAICDK